MAYKKISALYFMADSVNDLTNLPEVQMGATCFVIEEACEYKCTSEGAWIKQASVTSNSNASSGDLTGYATESYVDKKIADLVSSAPENLNTLHELATAFTENEEVLDALNKAIGDKAEKSDIPDVSNFQEKGDYALKGEIPSIAGLATEEFVNQAIAEAELNGSDTTVDLSNYALKSEIPSIEGLATEEYVNNAVANIDTATTSLPDYWVEHLAEKIATINNVNETAGYNGASLVFLTDTHWPANNNYSIDLINEVIEGTSIRKVFFGGDMLECDNKDSSIITLGREKEKKLNEKVILYPVRGNHDTTSSACGDTHWWDIFYGRLANRNVDVGNMYYYDDDLSHKIRYIILDMIAPESAVTTYFTNQLTWMEERIKELNAGWNVVIVGHSVWGALKVGTITTWGQALLDKLDGLCGNVKANIIAIISGHVHDDGAIQRSKGYAVISTDADRKADGGTGDITEQAFDVMNINVNTHKITITRIGRGSDRSISYTLNGNASAEGGSGDSSEDTNLTTIDITSAFAFDNVGSVNYSNGTITADTNWSNNNPVDVSTYEQLILTLPTSGNASTTVGYAFYNSANQYVSGSSLYGGTEGEYEEKTITIDVPSNATYFRTSLMTSNYDAYWNEDWEFIAKATTTEVNSDESEEEEEEETLTKTVTTDITDLFDFSNQGYVISTNGGIQADDTNWAYNDYVDVSAYDTLTASITTSGNQSTTVGLAFYNANKQFVSSKSYASGTAGVYELQTWEIDIPANATYIRMSTMTENYTEYYDSTWVIKIEGTGEVVVSLLSEDITALWGDFPINNNIQYADGLERDPADTSWDISDYVDVSKYEKIDVVMPTSTSSTTWAGAAFYDADKVFVEGHQLTNTEDAALETRTFTVPDNAVYFRSGLRNAAHSHGADDRSAFYAIGYYYE